MSRTHRSSAQSLPPFGDPGSKNGSLLGQSTFATRSKEGSRERSQDLMDDAVELCAMPKEADSTRRMEKAKRNQDAIGDDDPKVDDAAEFRDGFVGEGDEKKRLHEVALV
jgi:hypothetical protein